MFQWIRWIAFLLVGLCSLNIYAIDAKPEACAKYELHDKHSNDYLHFFPNNRYKQGSIGESSYEKTGDYVIKGNKVYLRDLDEHPLVHIYEITAKQRL